MGWEERKGKLFYYAKTTVNGRSCSTYMGNGPCAQLEAERVETERAIREDKRRRVSSIREEGRELTGAYRTLARYVRVNVSAALVLEGYRCHKRQWRRRRYPLPTPEPMPAKKKKKDVPLVPEGRVPVEVTLTRGHSITANIDASAAASDAERAKVLIERCNTNEPDAADLAALRKWMRRDGVMLSGEELARSVALKAVAHYKNSFLEEAILSGHADMIRSMGYVGADPIEGLLILQVSTAWILLHTVQEKLARIEDEGGHSLNAVNALSKRVDRAQNRFTKATETLEKIRALRRMTAANERPRALREHERQALPAHRGDGFFQPTDARELAVAKT